jgi:hypothetical protein
LAPAGWCTSPTKMACFGPWTMESKAARLTSERIRAQVND